VDVADDGLEVAHDLALERDEEPQHAVRGRVVGPHVEREELLLGPLDGMVPRRDVDALLALAVLGDLGAHCV
jgi:hypothetical protein